MAILFFSQSKDVLYVLTRSFITSVPQAYWSPCISVSADLWHHRRGHPTSRVLNFFSFEK